MAGFVVAGAVWRAYDEHLGREVAVKELRLPDQLARLKHPGIITVYDRVTGEDGRPRLVMEPVRGRSLADLLQAEGPLPPRRVARIGLRILDALSAAHRAGITHRDIKPANVLLEGDCVVVTDLRPGLPVRAGERRIRPTRPAPRCGPGSTVP